MGEFLKLESGVGLNDVVCHKILLLVYCDGISGLLDDWHLLRPALKVIKSSQHD